MIVYYIEIFNTNGTVPFAICTYRLSKISGKYYRDISDRELEKCKKIV